MPLAKNLTPEQRRARWREYRARWQAKYPGRKNALARERRRKTQTPESKRRNADYVRERKKQLQQTQAGRPIPDSCEACGRRRPLQFDHCHQRGMFRGWICGNCNAALGHVNDSPDHLRLLIIYLERTTVIVAPQMNLPFS